MATSSATFHEEALSSETRDRHRAIVSLMEELEAVDWYDQRVEAATDDALRDVLRHNRDEEKEHASMILEWLRRRDTALDRFLRTYLFTSAPITAIETVVEAGDDEAAAAAGPSSLGIGRLSSKEML